jgi:NAD(P)-dependent dehydrogenase (short-subunit alcohol dehydrogenase family)
VPTEEEHAFHPAGRVGSPEDVAALAAFLVGPDSHFITGSEFIIDGGVTRRMIYPE